jgi:hypothetical protein
LPDDTAWKCTQGYDTVINSGIFTSEDKQQPQGTESCQRAAALSARFGGYTALNQDFNSKIQKGVLDNVTGFLKKEIAKNTSVNLDFTNVQNLFDKAGNFVQSELDSLIGNPIKDSVATESQKIIDSAKKQIASTLNIPISSGISSIVGSEVPVKAQGVESKLDTVNNSVNNVIAEQKRQAIIQDTRDKCNNLLKTTTATIKKALLYQLSTQITDWIMTGKDPQFVKQPDQFLKDTGRLAIDRFISNVAPQLCQPFRLDVQIQIPAVTHETNPFYEQIRCTLDQVTNNIDNFYKDFRQGGWLTYQEILKPQNNYYGALMMTQSAALEAQNTAVQNAQQDLLQGRGFRSQTRCTSWAKYVPTTPPMLANKNQDGINYTISGTAAAQETTNDPPEAGYTQNSLRPYQYWNSAGTDFWECESYENTTPGTVAANLTEKANSTDLDYLPNAEDIDNFLQTIQDSIVNKLVKSGVNGLRRLIPSIFP